MNYLAPMSTPVPNQLVNTPNDEDKFLFAMEFVSSSTIRSVLAAAIELDLLEILSKAGSSSHLSCAEIASKIPTKNPNASEIIDRMLRFLASYSILTCKTITGDEVNNQIRLYGLAPLSKYLVRNEDGFSLGNMLLSEEKLDIKPWGYMKDVVLEEGKSPVERAYGKPFFEILAQDEEKCKQFGESMHNYTAILMNKILQVYQGFEGIKVIVDVGGGFGVNLTLILSKYPAIKAINFDLPSVIKNAPPVPGMEHVGGDMFDYIPKGEVIFMKWILHDWNNKKCVRLLKKCYDALPECGKVIIVELIIPEFSENNLQSRHIFRTDMYMLCGSVGAKERTMAEFEALAREAGFAAVKLMCCVCNHSVIEFYKNGCTFDN